MNIGSSNGVFWSSDRLPPSFLLLPSSKLRVQVDSSYGGCRSGNESCSAYADCNPKEDSHPIVWRCDCDTNTERAVEQTNAYQAHDTPGFLSPFATPRLVTAAAYIASTASTTDVSVLSPHGARGDSGGAYWGCSDALSQVCPVYGNTARCTACANTHAGALSAAGCTPGFIAQSCSSSFDSCKKAVVASQCALPPATTPAACQACAETAATEAANCSTLVVDYICKQPKPCNATGTIQRCACVLLCCQRERPNCMPLPVYVVWFFIVEEGREPAARS